MESCYCCGFETPSDETMECESCYNGVVCSDCIHNCDSCNLNCCKNCCTNCTECKNDVCEQNPCKIVRSCEQK